MCGIAGIINFSEESVDPFILKRMADIIAHRGPNDEEDVLLSSNSKTQGPRTIEFRDPEEAKKENLSSLNNSLGFRRLSIIDLSSAGQTDLRIIFG